MTARVRSWLATNLVSKRTQQRRRTETNAKAVLYLADANNAFHTSRIVASGCPR